MELPRWYPQLAGLVLWPVGLGCQGRLWASAGRVNQRAVGPCRDHQAGDGLWDSTQQTGRQAWSDFRDHRSLTLWVLPLTYFL